MVRVFRSMSGEPMELKDDDRVLCIMMDTPYQPSWDIHGRQVVGVTAIAIREALREEGFEIRRI